MTSEWPFLSTTTCGTALAANESCTVTLAYSPLNQIAAGTPSAPFNTDGGTLVIESDAASSPDLIELTGTVTPATVAVPSNTAPLFAYTVSQGSLVFAATAGGNVSAAQTVTLSNTGTATLHILRTATTADFQVTGTCPVLVLGASCPLNVVFTPQASSSQTTGPVIGALEIASDSSSSLDFISLTGTARPPTLSLAPVVLDFGSVLIGGSSTLSIRLTNGSNNPAVFHRISAGGDFTLGGDCPSPGASLASMASCTIAVIFKPSQAGSRTGTVSVATSLSTLPLTANLSGVGTESHLEVSPLGLSFGDVVLGHSTSLTVSLKNTGTALVSRLAFAATGDYTVTQPCGVTALAPGLGCSVTVSFAPSAAGVRQGQLTVTSSDANSPLNLTLSGNGTPAAAITLTVDGGNASTVKVVSGKPASFHLSVTSQYGYTGTVILNCTPVHAAQYAACSLLPSSITLSNGAVQSSVATLNTVTETTVSQRRTSNRGEFALCVLPLGVFFLRRGRGVLAIALIALTTLFAAGCGSGGTVILGDPSLRYTPAGSYQYQVTATSTTGTPLSTTVTLNLTVTAQQ
ncbi:MAG TPA: choice-of-anchor D domain-containing protein [Edaphobacter sp.]|nr:choice-of-anchor D domain-containing protein [Edaphobacter sp.]